MIKITEDLVQSVSEKAATVPRKRMNYNFHSEGSDPLQRMLNAMEPGTYIRPHRHLEPMKREAFILIRGKIAFIEFNDQGDVTDFIVMQHETGKFGVEISPGTYHSLVSLESGSVVYEIKDGPYDSNSDKEFASWSPEEGSPEGAEFVNRLLKIIKE